MRTSTRRARRLAGTAAAASVGRLVRRLVEIMLRTLRRAPQAQGEVVNRRRKEGADAACASGSGGKGRRLFAAGIRDRALLGVLAYSACRVGELVALRVGDFRTSGEHRVLAIYGKLFVTLAHNAANPAEYFGLPTDRTVVMGTQVDV